MRQSGRGPTISRWMWSKCASRVLEGPKGMTVWWWILARWQENTDLVHWWISQLIPDQTNWAVIKPCAAQIPGWAWLWKWSKMEWQKCSGMQECGDAVDISHITVSVECGSSRTWRSNDVELRNWVERDLDNFAVPLQWEHSQWAGGKRWLHWHPCMKGHQQLGCLFTSHDGFPKWTVKKSRFEVDEDKANISGLWSPRT